MHLRGVLWALGPLCGIYAAMMLLPDFVAWLFDDGLIGVFFASAAITASLGLVAWRWGELPRGGLVARDGFLIVASAWLFFSFCGALPFWLSGSAGFVDGLFESASGLTTTGVTIFTHLDSMPPSLLFWRSLQEWIGGMGIIVLAVAVMPMLGVGGMQLFRAEAPGPTKDKLVARVTETAKVLWFIYLGLTLLALLTYLWLGMDLFDAVNHAMTTVATGGFSTHDASFAAFENDAILLAATLFMFLAGINFVLHFAALRARSLRAYFQDDEFRAYLRWLLGILLLIALLVRPADLDAAMRLAFNVVSVATTTGFAASDYAQWPQATMIPLLAAMFVGACAGSTGGGMKVARALLLVRQGMREVRRLIHPHGVVVLRMSGRRVDYDVRNAVWGFFALYIVSFFVLAFVVAATGVEFLTAFSAAAACITNTGPGFGAVGPAGNYAGLPELAKLALVVGMVLGRLEVYTFFVLFVPEFWRR